MNFVCICWILGLLSYRFYDICLVYMRSCYNDCVGLILGDNMNFACICQKLS